MNASSFEHSVLRYFEDLGSPVALKCAALWRYKEFGQLAAVSVDPRNYLHAADYLRDVSAAALMKKCLHSFEGVDVATPASRRAKCVEKWWQGEKACYATNERLTRYLPEFKNSADRDERIVEFFSTVRKKVVSWIGTRPPALLSGRFGPGATASDRGRLSTIPDKMQSDPSITPHAAWYLLEWAGTAWSSAWNSRGGELKWTKGNRFTTVPKTAVIDRAIAAEPSINVFYQLALGSVLRDRLAAKPSYWNQYSGAGWDLSKAQEVHRRVAREASKSREFATLDLSNASDTVATNLVRLVLPHAWFDALNDLRSHRTSHPDLPSPSTESGQKWVKLEKFSSMGNGFTFELETIIFAAICCSVAELSGLPAKLGEDVFVYGDDIIVRDGVVKGVIAALRFCGFALNEEKSFFGETPFRESCGGDYFDGYAVRGHYLKKVPDEPQELIAFANGITRVSESLALTGFALPRRSWFSVLDALPSGVRSCRGPKDLGDIVIHDEETRWSTRWRSLGSTQYRLLKVYRPARYFVKKYDRYDPDVVLACALFGGTRNYQLGGVIPRDGVRGYKLGWVVR